MGLVTYESSDEESEPQTVEIAPETSNAPTQTALKIKDTHTQDEPNATTSIEGPAPPSLGPVMGPALGPSRPAEADTMTSLPESTPEPGPPPRSPHSSAQALLHDLTLPTVPDLDIPPSPPGTPPPGLDALNRKFDNLLELKRTKEVHFNERIAQSAQLRNPMLMDKLLGFVGIETDFDNAGAMGQYANTLSKELWNPSALPAWAYKSPLRKAQEKAHERPRGARVDFVAASDSSSRRP